jgi:phasin family protein
MFPVQDTISTDTRESLDAQISLLTQLTFKAFESMEKLAKLNLNAARVSLEESGTTIRYLLSVKDPQEIFSFSAAAAQPNVEKALAYSRHVAHIASDTQAEFTKAAETQAAEVNRKLIKLIEDTTKYAPVGGDHIAAVARSLIDTASAGYEQLSRTNQQAAEALEAWLTAAVNQFVTTKGAKLASA